MFTDVEIQLLKKLIAEHIVSIQPELKSQTIEKTRALKLQGELKASVSIRKKIEESNNTPARQPAKPINFNDTILVVDDDLISRELNVSLLKEMGFRNIKSALDGYHAMTAIKEQESGDNPISLIICDWNMPNMSGLELLGVIRNDPKISDMPFYLLTSNHDKAHVKTALKAGVTGYLVKPVSYEQLGDKLNVLN